MLDVSAGIRLCNFTMDARLQNHSLGKYMTLSHCYGTGQDVLRTTTHTLKGFEESIPWSDLPKTFQDAVNLTRALGVRWLWIDSLCILQDSASEKAEESNKLGGIFGNSYLTLAATSASDSREGLFFPRAEPTKLKAAGDKGVYVRERPTHYTFESLSHTEAHFDDQSHPVSISMYPAKRRRY
jgi:hypothetical protein